MASLSLACGAGIGTLPSKRNFEWLNEPPAFQVDSDGRRVSIEADSNTDFWQRTHYGFRVSNGHLLHTRIGRYASLSASVLSFPRDEYDQAGLMIWFDEDCWLKASVEFNPSGPSHLGAVVTNGGYSDWSLQDFEPPGGRFEYRLRIRREDGDFFVEHGTGNDHSSKLIRIAHLSPSERSAGNCFAGLYACSPKGKGFRAQFDSMSVESQS